jgi:hypothetical protein
MIIILYLNFQIFNFDRKGTIFFVINCYLPFVILRLKTINNHK